MVHYRVHKSLLSEALCNIS